MKDSSIMSQAEMDSLLAEGAAGDIVLRFFDVCGKKVASELDERVIGITLEELKNVNRVVGVSGGQGKQNAIRGALLGKFINVLITDNLTAGHLVSQPD